MKLLQTLREEIATLGGIRRAWLTSFNINIEFVERYILPALVEQDPIQDRMAAEELHHRLFVDLDTQLDVQIFADRRMIGRDDTKWTAIPIHGVSPRLLDGFANESLFHPKVIYLEGANGAILGCGSANLTVEGWSRQQECYAFQKVTTKEQVLEIRSFFEPLFKQSSLTTFPWSSPTLWPSGESNWDFVHSFQASSFLERLFSGEKTENLIAWSPYFASDLGKFLTSVREKSGISNLRVHLIPDLLNGASIRTQDSNDLEQQRNSGLLTFRSNPIDWHAPPEVDKFCHAKVWMTKQKLAIGSWNFTGPGSNAGTTHEGKATRRNIEAGFIFPNCNKLDSVLAKTHIYSSPKFATAEEMKREALVIPPDIPVDVTVSFDWAERRYRVTNQTNQATGQYYIRLPDVLSPAQLPAYNAPKEIIIHYANEISFNHYFQILDASGVSISQGIIHELNPEFRRGEGFDTLDDILDSLIPEIANSGGGGRTTPRGKKAEDADGDPTPVITGSRISYYRLFLAMSLFDEKLKAVLSMSPKEKPAKELEMLVFVFPGCLEEIAEKLRELPSPSDSDAVFRWFLVQEVKLLIWSACETAKKLGISLSDDRWKNLHAGKLPILSKASRKYLKHIENSNKYGVPLQ